MTKPLPLHRPPRLDDAPSAGADARGEGDPREGRTGSRRARRRRVALPVLAIAVALVLLVSLGLGPVRVPLGDTIAILAGAAGGRAPAAPNALVVTELRVPRALLALLAGAALGAAGAVMQAYFRNPLADPGVTGVASGAAVGAVLVIVLGLSALGPWTLPAAAFAGGLAVLVVIQGAALAARDRSATTVLLAGIAVNALCGAATGAIVANAEDSQTVRGAVFWLQGDLTSASWNDLAMATAPVLAGLAALAAMTRELDALLLGDETASSMGVDVPRVRAVLLVLTSLVIGGVIAVTGVIGFVGLVAPHIVRLLLGSDHRVLLPGAALLGALFLLVADTAARLAPGGTTWQTGVVTALVGAPVFLGLVLRSRGTSRRVP